MNYFVVLMKVKGDCIIIYDLVFGERRLFYKEVFKCIIGIVFEVLFSDSFSLIKVGLWFGFI